MRLTDVSIKYLLFFIVLLSADGCIHKDGSSKDLNHLRPTNTFKIDVPEPSGLALSYDGNFLWTVSDQNNTIYAVSFDGRILNHIRLYDDEKNRDIEGVAAVNDTTLAVIFERERTIALINPEGKIVKSRNLDLKGPLNSGIEGLSYDRKEKRFYVLNEKEPGMLIELDSDLNILNKKEINFAADFSAVDFDDSTQSLWILSDEDRKVFKCDTQGKILNAFSIKSRQPEGIAIENKSGRMYIVSDSDSKLYIYDIKKN